MALLISLSAIFAVEGKKLVDTYRFKLSIQLLKNEEHKAKFESLIYRTDIELELCESKEGLQLSRKCDEPGFARLKPIYLPGITEVYHGGKKQKKIAIAKYSCGYCVYSEKLELRHKKEKEFL